ncbi:putative proteasome regulatory non-ATPase subunit [Trypanosoma rangeli]|uniref:Autophagy-related protein 9 n=1 Tax=Trypanosoma rangeli TaxID=5698 RepID=A0A422NTE4_TRYRA|nr:putative proteasome regulatory non-ATPase subunit [Trypanosoma rangeli]RNF08738.1 putative proteasome regulatory non-ATPase subunit [Trypanosoma rangeli]|eukprot:RNF08738.1 putative proteasome regulatory non-ATPase subunit [Trypanosoma rangeli]
MGFIRVPSFSLRYQGSGRIEDIHLFMTCLYQLWYHRGPWNCCLASLVDFLNSLVLFCVVFFLALMFDWPTALNCDEVSCGHVTLVHGVRRPTIFGTNHMVLALILLLSSSVAAVYELLRFVETCRLQSELYGMLRGLVDCGYITPVHRLLHRWRSMCARVEGHEEIGLTGGLQFVGDLSWGSFLDLVCERIQKDRDFGIVAHKEFDSLRAVQALMVYDNYFIALHEHGVLEKGTLKYVDNDLLKIIICGMFDEFNTLKDEKNQVSLVRWQVIKCLVCYVLLYPFVVTLSLLRVLIKNAAIMRSDWGNYMEMDWSNHAQWNFRLYNEVPHFLSARLSAGRKIAVGMVLQLQPYTNVGRFIRRMASMVVFVTLLISFMNAPLFISGTIGGISFVWWLSIALVLFTVFTDKIPVQREYNYTVDLSQLIVNLHYWEDEWMRSGERFYTALTRTFLKSRATVILADLAHTLFMPVILLGVLFDGSIVELVNGVFNETVTVDGLGSVSRGSAFGLLCAGSSDDAALESCLDEKGAKSIASFSAIYAGWSAKRMQAAEEVCKTTESGLHSTAALNRLVKNLHEQMNVQNHPDQIRGSACFSSAFRSAPANEGFLQSTLWGQSNAHEREKMFVSQVMGKVLSEFPCSDQLLSGLSSHGVVREGVLGESGPFQTVKTFYGSSYHSSDP